MDSAGFVGRPASIARAVSSAPDAGTAAEADGVAVGVGVAGEPAGFAVGESVEESLGAGLRPPLAEWEAVGAALL